MAASCAIDAGLGTRIALYSCTREYLDVVDGADHSRRHAQRRIYNVGSLLAKDRAQQLFFGSQLGFALGRYLADQHVVGTPFTADVNNAGIIQTLQLCFSQVADVTCAFFRAPLAVAGANSELIDVARRITAVPTDLFGAPA